MSDLNFEKLANYIELQLKIEIKNPKEQTKYIKTGFKRCKNSDFTQKGLEISSASKNYSKRFCPNIP